MTFMDSSFWTQQTPTWSSAAQSFPQTSQSQRRWWSRSWKKGPLCRMKWRYGSSHSYFKKWFVHLKKVFESYCLVYHISVIPPAFPSHTEGQYLHLWPEEDGRNTSQALWWWNSACDRWTLFVLLEPRKQTDANSDTGHRPNLCCIN